VLVAVRPGLEAALERIQAAYPPVATTDTSNTVRLQLTQVLMTLLDLKTANHEDRLLREQLEARDRHVAAMEQRVAVLDLQLDRANHDLKQLDELQRELSSKDLHIANLESRLANELRTKDEHILYLEKLLEGIERGRVLRLTRRISRLIGR
jgi:predicted RNase H-like nuclease (RuvC/YqgF family)